jgi:hypothetical protein
MKNFDELLRGRKREPFQLGGQEFTIRARIHARSFAKMLASVQDLETAEQTIDATARFMEYVVVPEDRERFMCLFGTPQDGEDDVDEDNVITIDQVHALVGWVIEHYTGKLLTQEESSSPGASSTPTQQNVLSFNPVSKNQAS